MQLSQEPLISICIPTFNRCEKVQKLVLNILNYQGNNIEVIVLDNRSTDETKSVLSAIKDERFSFIQNEKNIGGPLNHLKVITEAKGTYAFFCLDKDWLDFKAIDGLIEQVTANLDVVFGHCALNLSKPKDNTLFDRGLASIMNMAYLSQHPTGVFYKPSVYRNLNILKDIFARVEKFPFYPDLTNGEMAVMGKSLLINYPAFYTESEEDCEASPSFTYSEIDVFFAPKQRLKELDMYLNSALKLKLPSAEFEKLALKLYDRSLMYATIGYKANMKNKAVCAHYGMTTRYVSFKETINTTSEFLSHFMASKWPLSNFLKLYIVSYGYLKVMVKSALFK